MSIDWPYLTADIPGVAMTFRAYFEDFLVEEIPAYLPGGSGTHVYFTVEKSGLSTHEAVSRIAAALKRKSGDIGFAGLKDAKAVTRQAFSVEHIEPALIEGMQVKGLKVLSIGRHTNKLKTGHLKGNRFVLKLRNIEPECEADLRRCLAILEEKGVPNYFGSQRFGMRGDTWKIGRALLKGDFKDAVELIAGIPEDWRNECARRASEAFMRGEYQKAAPLWPAGFREAAKLSWNLVRTQGDMEKAVTRLDKPMLKFYVSAFQSYLFNDYLARRMERLDEILTGDWVVKHSSGALFLAESGEEQTPRARLFEVSAAGPVFGKKMRKATGEARCLEEAILEGCGVAEPVFSTRGLFFCAGDRRALRFKPAEASLEKGSDEHGGYYQLCFTLPPGCYATSVLREMAKDKLTEGKPRQEQPA